MIADLCPNVLFDTSSSKAICDTVIEIWFTSSELRRSSAAANTGPVTELRF
jgi:hypothetical protein